MPLPAMANKMPLSRKFTFFLFAVLILISFSCPANASGESAPGAEKKSIGQTFGGEELVYDIGVWFFSKVAQGRLLLVKDGPHSYTATLTARTTGIIDTLLRHRRDRYVVKLRMSADGSRFLTESFEKTVSMDNKEARKGTYHFDYAKKTITWKSWGAGKEEKSGTARMPDGVYVDDPIGAFYNFRYGVYGPIENGRNYDIPSFPKEDRFPEIHIRVATEKELKKRIRSGNKPDFLADARIDKELFGSINGDVEIRFTRGMLPVQAIAKGLVFFGDVKGRLSEVNLLQTAAEKGPSALLLSSLVSAAYGKEYASLLASPI